MADESKPEGISPGPVFVIEDLTQQRLPARRMVSLLERAGWSAQLVDLNQSVSEIVACAVTGRPGLIVGSILFAERVNEYLALMTALRGAGLTAHLSLAGPLPSLAYLEMLSACPALDSVIVGEAQAVIVSLAAHVQDAWSSLEGIACRTNSPVPLHVPNLDALPYPSRLEGIPARLGYGFATVESSRGCYHDCSHCLPRANDGHCHIPYRTRRPSQLVDEIEALYLEGTRLFLFDDEQFLAPEQVRAQRIGALGDELARRNLHIAITVKCRADDVETALFRQLQEMGLVRVYVGIESGSQFTLDLLNKGTTVEQNVQALRTLSALGLVADFHTLAFHPWSDLYTLEGEHLFSQRVLPYMPTLFDWCEVEIYAGTRLAERLGREGRAEGTAWCPGYTLSDPRAELVRRTSRLLFQPSSHYGQTHTWLTTAWFDHLLRQRFEPSACEQDRADSLKRVARRVNDVSLGVWREMLAFVRAGDIYDAREVNARAEEWAGCINRVCMLDVFYPSSGSCVGA